MDQVMVRMSSDANLVDRCLLLVVSLVKSEKLNVDELKCLPKNLNYSILNIFSKRGYLNDQNIHVFLNENTKILDLCECYTLTDVSLEKIAQTCKNLTKIDLNSNHTQRELITSHGITNLALNCKHLQTILLRRCILIDDSCIQDIAQNCKTLNYLNIANCPLITDNSLAALGQNCHFLKSINFSGNNKITDSGVFSLFSSTNLSFTIEEIHMAHCDLLTDESIECILLNCKRIKYLLFHCCPSITDASRIALEDYMRNDSNQRVQHLTWSIY